MRPIARNPLLVLTAALTGAVAIAAAAFAQAPGFGPAEPAAAKVVGSDACAKCHAAEVNQWRATPHFRTFEELHRTPEAKAIADRLGIRSVKRGGTCVRCHYTQQEVNGRMRVTEGVSCESCHGAAQDWLDLHADYGPGANRQTESADHRRERRLRSVMAGMNNPGNLYLVARQCLDCHTAPDEQLVEVGGHTAGSTDFDLVAWSQGMVRHNFVRSGGAANAPSGPERLRVMHVVGVMTDLEYSLRAVAGATQAGVYGKTAAGRAAAKKAQLWRLQRKLESPLVAPALEAVAAVELRLGNAAAILAAADAVGVAAYNFAEQADGATLAAIDDELPSPAQYK
ncbi:Perchlorate reductase subunit gamma precursor [Pseudobythopirellula maris]|uniref:Perchlorate reductase subunit gamma n=1 Tax=Pseudobythopirellula maris TaxID=2527991 RepID=A0A5C5ZJT6_9BACT|nr:cytochrome c family protein [Pseudobythopirellula maris]TWT87470.1 Perchlorate reductase subunit gamma precursor [Pseudobythopirellula maris]